MMAPAADRPVLAGAVKEAADCQRQIEFKGAEGTKSLEEGVKPPNFEGLRRSTQRVPAKFTRVGPIRELLGERAWSSNTPTLDGPSEGFGEETSWSSLGERPEALQKAQDRGSDMRRSSFEDNRDKIYGRPTRLMAGAVLPAQTICSERYDQLRRLRKPSVIT